MLAPSGTLDPGYVVVEDGKIREIGRGAPSVPAGALHIDAAGLRVAPGFIDTHTHGINGHDAMTGTEGIEGMSAEHASHGVTAFLPTLVSAPRRELLDLVARTSGVRGSGARVLGLHLEGPFLDPAMPGMFDPAAFRPFDAREFGDLAVAAGGALKLITLACQGARSAALPAILEAGVIPSLGHAAGGFDDGIRAFDAGARRCTHCFNAMTGFHHREPGLVGAVLDRADVLAELIFDGLHVAPPVGRLLLALKGPEGVILVTDSIVCAGFPDGDYEWAGYSIRIAGGAARIPAGNLAGSVLTLDQAVRNAVSLLGASVEAAVEMASLTPARAIEVHSTKGNLAPGKDADIVLLDSSLSPVATMVEGEVVWKADPAAYQTPR